MYSFLIPTALALALGAIFYRHIRRMPLQRRVRTWLSLFVFAIFGGFALSLGITCLAPLTQELVRSEQLVAMRTSDGLSGTFILGSGSIAAQSTYLFYVQNADGSVSPRYLKADPDVKIFQNSAYRDRGEWKTYRLIVDPNWFLAGFALQPDRERNLTHVLTVPEGTVVQEFTAR